MRYPCNRLSSVNKNRRNERSRLPLRIIRVRLPLFPSGKIIVPCNRAAVIDSGGEFIQKVANTAYVTQLVFYLPEWGARRHLTLCLVIVVITVCQVSYLRILNVTIGPCHKRRSHWLGMVSLLSAQYVR